MVFEDVVDPAFIQESEHRAKPIINEAESIPLIDLSPLLSAPIPTDDDHDNFIPNKAISGLVADVEAACREWGFFQVINHGVPIQLLDQIQLAAKEFFALPLQQKQRVRRNEDNYHGYHESERTKNVRDWKEVFDFGVSESGHGLSKNQWPEYPPGLREVCKEYSKAVEDLAFKLLKLISLTLNLPPRRLESFFKDTTSFIRFNRYPVCPSPELALGVGRHKDPGVLTVLAQDDVGGLDVKRKGDCDWVRVKPIPNSYIINIGDIIQVWSNDKYESAEHRVTVNSSKARLSVPFFFFPAHYTMVSPLEELVSEENPAKYHEYNWGEFLKARRTGDYRKMGVENIQISHFRKTP